MAKPTSILTPTPLMTAKLPRSIWALGLVSLLMDISSEMIHSLLPVFMLTTLGVSVFTIGLIEGGAEATALIAKIFSGVLSDYWRRRKALALFGYALGALAKPLFALASSGSLVLGARLIDRVGKGIRGAPRDALVADIAPPALRGAAFGLRQALDTVGAFLGPLLAMGLMLLWANNFRAIFWLALIPAWLSVALLFFGVREPSRNDINPTAPINPLRWANLSQLHAGYWWVVGIGALLMLARFSEAFLVLRAQQGGLRIAFAPLVLIGLNIVYALSAYPFGKLADRYSHSKLLAYGLIALIAADFIFAASNTWTWMWLGLTLWGLHLGITQGLLAAMVAATAPAHLRGTAFGFFNLLSGIALLLASGLAGLVWDHYGAAFTFLGGAMFGLLALTAIIFHTVFLWRKSARAAA